MRNTRLDYIISRQEVSTILFYRAKRNRKYSKMDKTSFSHKPSRGSQQGPSLDRQITIQDVECLKEAFALFDADRKEAITSEELGKVNYTHLELLFDFSVLNLTLRRY